MKNYTIEIRECIEKPKKKEQPPKSDDSLLLLVLAIIIGVFRSPDLIDLKDYIPKDKQDTTYESSNSF